jgi:polar amino acid transport system permease protein/cystine transport system permease protein
MRGTPALVQLFIIYFGLSDLGIEFEPKMAAIIGLGLNGAAYVGEIYRAGIKAIHIGQMEAALTLGMTPINAMRFIIMPQAIRIVLPPLCNYAILLVKDTAIISTIAAPEVMFEARRIVQATFMHSVSGQIYLIAAFIYLIITIPMSFVTKQLEKAKDAWT